ncbi:MAG: hypothetical protein H7249_19120 [Chitinophagaceae bacterium]|nr:hypothetical protein [Oligoflexus sp.]
MNSFLSKPIEHDVLLGLIDLVYAESGVPSFDSDVISGKFKGMETVLVDILKAYCETYPKNKDEIKEALAHNDPALCTAAIHGLRGMISNFQSRHILDKLSSLENSFLLDGCTNENAGRIRALLDGIDQANFTLKTLLESLEAGRV